MLKYGIKLWSINQDWFLPAVEIFKENKIDFIELYIVPDSFSFSGLSSLKNIPVFIHAPHYSHDFNIFKWNNQAAASFRKTIEAADYFKSKFIIIHSGVGTDKENFKKNIEKISDRRIVIENKPKKAIGGEQCFGYSLEQLKFIKKACGSDICLDFTHAIKSAFSQKIDYKKFVLELINELSPRYFHIGGCFTNNGESDEHLNLWEGDTDIKWIKNELENLAQKEDIYLVFEVPKNEVDLKNDLANIEFFKKIKI